MAPRDPSDPATLPSLALNTGGCGATPESLGRGIVEAGQWTGIGRGKERRLRGRAGQGLTRNARTPKQRCHSLNWYREIKRELGGGVD